MNRPYLAANEDPLPSGTRVDRYEVVRRVGNGATGVVYEARHVSLGTPVALKVLWGDAASDPVQRTRLIREARVASAISHRNVVRVFDLGSHRSLLYLAMELLRGQSLAEHIKRAGPLGVRRAADVFLPVLAGVQVMHARGILHRDLKPANIFLAEEMGGELVPKVLDFGLTRVDGGLPNDPERTHEGMSLGSPAFMSPEHVAGAGRITHLSDQFSLAASLYLCVLGRYPFRGDSPHHTMSLIALGNFPKPSEVDPSISPRFNDAICRAMATAPADRFSSLVGFGEALLPLASAATQSAMRHMFRPSDDMITVRVPVARPAPVVRQRDVVEAVTPAAPRADVSPTHRSITPSCASPRLGPQVRGRRVALISLALSGAVIASATAWRATRGAAPRSSAAAFIRTCAR